MKETILSRIIDYYKKKSKVSLRSFTDRNMSYDLYLKIYHDYFNRYQNEVNNDIKIAIEEYFNEGKQNHENNDVGINLSLNNATEDIEFIALINLHVFFRLFKMRDYETRNISKITEFELTNNENHVIWYRGQSDSSWNIIPTMFRDNKLTKLWTWNEILNELSSKPQRNSVASKLSEINLDIQEQPYRTMAYIQHAISYSLLIDFTKSKDVSLSFALTKRSSLSSYYNTDSCVFELSMPQKSVISDLNQINKVILNSKVQVINQNEYIVKMLENEMWIKLIKGNSSVIHLLDFPTNDRMLYQKGTFALFDNAIIIGGEVFLSYDKVKYLKEHLVKKVIQYQRKEVMLKTLLRKSPQYHQRYLMDPYLYLDEVDL